MIIQGQLLSASNLNGAYISKTNTNSQAIASDLTISGGSLTLKNSVITDNTSSSYLNIRPQNSTLTIYDGVHNESLYVYGSSGSDAIYATTITGSPSKSIIDVTSNIDHLEINTNTGKPVYFGGKVGLGTSSPRDTLDIRGGVVIGTNLQATNVPADGGLAIGNTTVSYSGNKGGEGWDSTGDTLTLHAKDYSTIAFLQAGTRVDYIRGGAGNIDIGYDGQWGRSNVLFTSGIWDNTGKVGVGNTSPTYTLDVKGSVRFDGAGGNVVILDNSVSGDNTWLHFYGTGTRLWGISPDWSSNPNGLSFYDYTNNTARVVFNQNGNVGIGTISPSATLHVNGNGLIGTGGDARSTSGLSVSVNSSTTFGSNTDPSDANRTLSITNPNATSGSYSALSFRVGASQTNDSLFDIKAISATSNGGKLVFSGHNNSGAYADFMAIQTNGNVGIGTTSPAHTLDVVGSVSATVESHFSNGTLVDPHTGVAYGLKVSQGIATDSLYLNGTINIPNTSTASGKAIQLNSITIDPLASSATSGLQALAIGNLAELRFGTSTNWDWNVWAGLKYDSTNNDLWIGGPSSSQFSDNTSPPNISVIFDGIDHVQTNGNLYVNNHGFNGTPAIALAVGDTDTGLHSTTDGTLMIYSNNTSVASVRAGSGITMNEQLNMNSQWIEGVSYISGNNGVMMRSTDAWLRINDIAPVHASGVYLGSSIVRTDGTLQVGSNGATFNANSSSFTYNGNTIWHAGNDGSGSGLDADTIDGKQANSLMWMTNANGFDGLQGPNAGTSNWIRTTSNGLIPYTSGGSGSLGTSTWNFNTIYGVTIYENNTSLASKYLGINATASSASSVPWSGVSSKPTTLSGYGITDAMSSNGGTMSGSLTVNGSITINNGTQLGTTSGDTLNLLDVHGLDANTTHLITRLRRTSNGTDWTTSAIDLIRYTDSTYQQYLSFYGNGGGIGTSNNMLDDGAGNFTAKGSVSTTYVESNGQTNFHFVPVVGGSAGITNNARSQWGLRVTDSANPASYTLHNTLDDGSGNMTINGALNVSGASTISGATSIPNLTANGMVSSSEVHFSNGTYSDPQSGSSRGLKVSQGIATDYLWSNGNIDLSGGYYASGVQHIQMAYLGSGAWPTNGAGGYKWTFTAIPSTNSCQPACTLNIVPGTQYFVNAGNNSRSYCTYYHSASSAQSGWIFEYNQ